MFSRIVGFECAAGAHVSKADERRAAIVMVAGTLVLTAAWIVAHRRSDGNPYVESMSVMAFFIPLLCSMRYTQLKGRPLAVQVVFIGGFSILLTAFMLASAWVSVQI